MNQYVVATTKEWNINAYNKFIDSLPGKWHLITSPEHLSLAFLQEIKPRYIFFPHWSWIVPDFITEQYECVCFHLSDVPYGRGGSPLQNLIIRGHEDTKLTALRMVSELDAGPVYGKLDLSLEGRAQDIFNRAANKVYDLIYEIIENERKPQPQVGEAVVFQRRTPDQSRMPESCTMEQLYDHIRMMDAESYPLIFIEYGDFRIEFSHAIEGNGEIKCRTVITKVK